MCTHVEWPKGAKTEGPKGLRAGNIGWGPSKDFIFYLTIKMRIEVVPLKFGLPEYSSELHLSTVFLGHYRPQIKIVTIPTAEYEIDGKKLR